MTALEVEDLGNQIDVLLERYEATANQKVRIALEGCISANFGVMERLTISGDIERGDYEHYRTLTYLVIGKNIEPDRRGETQEEREERVIKTALGKYAEKYKKAKGFERAKIDNEVSETLHMLVPLMICHYWDYYQEQKGE